MDGILHQRIPGMIRFPCKNQQAMASTMVSKWCELDVAPIHSMENPVVWGLVPSASFVAIVRLKPDAGTAMPSMLKGKTTGRPSRWFLGSFGCHRFSFRRSARSSRSSRGGPAPRGDGGGDSGIDTRVQFPQGSPEPE